MQLGMRWFGPDDPVSLEDIRQIPGVSHIVTALSKPPGELWSIPEIELVFEYITKNGLSWKVVESLHLSEAIKLGRPERDQHIENFINSLVNLAQFDIDTVVYNLMPLIDWARTDFKVQLKDGSFALAYDVQNEKRLIELIGTMPGWSLTQTNESPFALIEQYKVLGEEGLVNNYTYFLKSVIPVAEQLGVKLALHPDDPPWPILSMPRIAGSAEQLSRLLKLYDSPVHGLTFCTGSLGASEENNLVEMIKLFHDRIFFVHARNIKRLSSRSFVETAHPSDYGDLNMKHIIHTLIHVGYKGPIRSDHGRNIWGEQGRLPGYGLYDRALGTTYLYGLIEGLTPDD